jgi:uncharacterized MnhB-related membrane protein
MISVVIGVMFGVMILTALRMMFEEDLETLVILFLSISLESVVLFFIFQAPDVALTEAVIGSGLSAVILLFNIKHFKAKS